MLPNEAVIFSFYNFLILLGLFVMIFIMVVYAIKIHHNILTIIKRQKALVNLEIEKHNETNPESKIPFVD